MAGFDPLFHLFEEIQEIEDDNVNGKRVKQLYSRLVKKQHWEDRIPVEDFIKTIRDMDTSRELCSNSSYSWRGVTKSIRKKMEELASR